MSFCPPLFSESANGFASFSSDAGGAGGGRAASGGGSGAPPARSGVNRAIRKLRYHNKNRTVFVTRMPPDADEITLANAFAEFGLVVGVYVERNDTGDSMNYAFVELDSEEHAIQAVKAMDRRILKGPVPHVAARCITVDHVRGSRAGQLVGERGRNEGGTAPAPESVDRLPSEPSASTPLDRHPPGQAPTLSPYMRAAQTPSHREPSHQRGPDPYARGSDPYARERDPYARGPDPYARGPDPYARGSDPYARGPDPYARRPDPYARGPDPYARGPDPYSRGPDPYARGPDPYARGPDAYARGPDPYARGPDAYARGPDSYARGPDSYARGADGDVPPPDYRAPSYADPRKAKESESRDTLDGLPPGAVPYDPEHPQLTDSPPYSPLTPPAATPDRPAAGALELLASMLQAPPQATAAGQRPAGERSDAGHADEEGIAAPDLSPSAWKDHLGEVPQDEVFLAGQPWRPEGSE
jgi:hypothetical protein